MEAVDKPINAVARENAMYTPPHLPDGAQGKSDNAKLMWPISIGGTKMQ
jgi:hypothetical protein